MKVTQRNLFNLPPGRHFDTGTKTLHLWVRPTGGRAWVQRLRVGGKPVERGLGGAEFVALADARAAAAANRLKARTGGDPFADCADARRRPAAAPTFGMAADECRAANLAAWRKASVDKWDSIRRKHLPRLAGRPVAGVTRQAVIDLLQAMPAPTARHCRRVIRMAFEIAIVKGWASENPAAGIDAALPHLRSASSTPRRAAGCEQAPAIFNRLLAAGTSAADCLAWIMLTWARSAEGRGAAWDEIDLDAALWTIPAGRMKTRKAHRVPLSDQAAAILRRRAARCGRPGLIFPGRRPGRPMAAETLNRLLADDDATVHGMRSCGATWAAENGWPREVHQHQLAHAGANGNATERSYDRSTRLDERRELMRRWAAHLAGGAR